MSYEKSKGDEIADIVSSGTERSSDRWESFTEQFIDAVEGADLVVDAGAEFGFYTRLALREGAKRVIAIDPDPTRCAVLCRLQAEVHQVALSNVDGNATAIQPANEISMALSGLVHASGRSSVVRTTTLDKILDGRMAAVIKMDVEGAEDAALLGALNALASMPMLFIEFHPPADLEARTATLKMLVRLGYAVPREAGLVYGGARAALVAR